MFEQLWRLAHVFWRITRGQTLDVRVLATNGNGAAMLVQLSQSGLWRLPNTLANPGETALAAGRRALGAAGAKFNDLSLYHIYRGPGWPEADHVALYHAKGISMPDASGESPARFFAPDALPERIEPASCRRIAEIMAGAQPPEDW